VPTACAARTPHRHAVSPASAACGTHAPGKKPEVEVMVPVRAVALTGSGAAKSPKPGVRARLFRRLPGIRESACSPAGGTAASHAAEP